MPFKPWAPIGRNQLSYCFPRMFVNGVDAQYKRECEKDFHPFMPLLIGLALHKMKREKVLKKTRVHDFFQAELENYPPVTDRQFIWQR